MVRTFGFTVMDHGVALARCPQCSALSSVNAAFPESDWNSLYHMVSVLETFIETREYQVICQACKHDIVVTGGHNDSEYLLWHAHYLPESRQDLQLLIKRKNGCTDWIEGMLVDERAAITPIPLPSSEAEFSARAGCYFSLRQIWKEFLQQEWPVKRFAGMEISRGYFILLNQAVDADEDLRQFKENCVDLVASSPQAGTQFEFADLSWADSWNFKENTYHQWLSDFASDVEQSNIIAGVLACPQQFFNIIQDELRTFDCFLRRSDEKSTVAVLGDDNYYVSFDYRECLVNAMIKGYTYWGALRFVEPMLDSWEDLRDTGERLKRLLPGYECTVYGGHYFQCRSKSTKRIVKEFDMLGLAESDGDVTNDEEFLEWISPQISLNRQTLKFSRQ